MHEFADALMFNSCMFTALEALKKSRKLKLLNGPPFVVRCKQGWLVTSSPQTRLTDERGASRFIFKEHLSGIFTGILVDNQSHTVQKEK